MGGTWGNIVRNGVARKWAVALAMGDSACKVFLLPEDTSREAKTSEEKGVSQKRNSLVSLAEQTVETQARS